MLTLFNRASFLAHRLSIGVSRGSLNADSPAVVSGKCRSAWPIRSSMDQSGVGEICFCTSKLEIGQIFVQISGSDSRGVQPHGGAPKDDSGGCQSSSRSRQRAHGSSRLQFSAGHVAATTLLGETEIPCVAGSSCITRPTS